jgi:hypothetical protein
MFLFQFAILHVPLLCHLYNFKHNSSGSSIYKKIVEDCPYILLPSDGIFKLYIHINYSVVLLYSINNPIHSKQWNGRMYKQWTTCDLTPTQSNTTVLCSAKVPQLVIMCLYSWLNLLYSSMGSFCGNDFHYICFGLETQISLHHIISFFTWTSVCCSLKCWWMTFECRIEM